LGYIFPFLLLIIFQQVTCSGTLLPDSPDRAHRSPSSSPYPLLPVHRKDFESLEHHSSLLQGLNQLREKGQLLDVTLWAENRPFQVGTTTRVARWFFQTKNLNLDKFWTVLQWKIFIYFMAIWSILRPFGIFCGHLVNFRVIWYNFSSFGMLSQEKSGKPDYNVGQLFGATSV
jgi:hypothetical protein